MTKATACVIYKATACVITNHRHLKNIDCLSHLVCFISIVNGRNNKKRKEEAYPWKDGASSGHITNLKQSILETFDIYVTNPLLVSSLD